MGNVVASGPAANAGLRAGDRIKSIDDAPVDRAKLAALTLAAAGSKFRIELEDGSVRTLTLGAYY